MSTMKDALNTNFISRCDLIITCNTLTAHREIGSYSKLTARQLVRSFIFTVISTPLQVSQTLGTISLEWPDCNCNNDDSTPEGMQLYVR